MNDAFAEDESLMESRPVAEFDDFGSSNREGGRFEPYLCLNERSRKPADFSFLRAAYSEARLFKGESWRASRFIVGQAAPRVSLSSSLIYWGNFQMCVEAFSAPIQSFFPEPIEVLKPFLVTVHQTGEDYLASFFDANINASGDTEEEAVSNIKDMIVATFELLSNKPERQLGPGPKKQLAVLNQFLRWVK